MPQRQAGKLQHTRTHSAVLQRLEGIDGKHEVCNLLMLPQLPASFQSDNTVKEAWKSVFALAEPIPSWHVFSELLVDHEDDGHDVLVCGCLLIKIWPEVVFQILRDLQQHDTLQLGSCVLTAVQI